MTAVEQKEQAKAAAVDVQRAHVETLEEVLLNPTVDQSPILDDPAQKVIVKLADEMVESTPIAKEDLAAIGKVLKESAGLREAKEELKELAKEMAEHDEVSGWSSN